MAAFPMKAWGWCIRTIGAISGILALWGFYLQILAIRRVLSVPNRIPNIPFFGVAFFTMTFVDTIFIFMVVLVGIFMVRLQPRAATIYVWLMPLIIVLEVSVGGLWSLPDPWGRSIAAASGIGAVGTGPLMLYPVPFVYPILSMVIVLLARQKLASLTVEPTLAAPETIFRPGR